MHQRHHIGSVIFLVVFGIYWYLTNSKESLNTGEIANYQHGVQHCVNGKSFIVEDRAHNCSLKTSFNPYTLSGTDVQSLIPSLPESQNICLPVKFSTPHRMPRTALASHPGSGNGWTRHLIQQLTGVYTGDVYKILLAYGKNSAKWITDFAQFPKWVWNGSCIAIKTHEGMGTGKIEYNPKRYDKSIVLIRDPHDSLMTEYKRQYSTTHGRPQNITEDIFAPEGGFKQYFRTAVKSWRTFYHNWLREDMCTLVVQYEHLQHNLHTQLLRIAQFLGVNVNNLRSSHLDCLLDNTGSWLIRPKVKDPSYPYTKDMLEVLEKYRREVRAILRERHGIHDITF